jgi:hypothetical protein
MAGRARSLILVTLLTVGCGDPPTDSEIADAVGQRLRSDSALSRYSLSVDTSDGAVTLGGVVGSDQERALAQRLAERIDGVSEVRNEISITPSDAPAVGAPPPATAAPTADKMGPTLGLSGGAESGVRPPGPLASE